jgi:hypothetical protein
MTPWPALTPGGRRAVARGKRHASRAVAHAMLVMA